jgi:hypothetical protein
MLVRNHDLHSPGHVTIQDYAGTTVQQTDAGGPAGWLKRPLANELARHGDASRIGSHDIAADSRGKATLRWPIPKGAQLVLCSHWAQSGQYPLQEMTLTALLIRV